MGFWQEANNRLRKRHTQEEVKEVKGVERGAGTAICTRKSGGLETLPPPTPPQEEFDLYDALKGSIPIIEAAIQKIVRLMGDFRLVIEPQNRLLGEGEDGSIYKSAQNLLEDFVESVPVGISATGLHSFIDGYLDSLLTYGSAVGELLKDKGRVKGICNAPVRELLVGQGDSPITPRFYKRNPADPQKPFLLNYQERILFTAINPPAHSPYGVSVLRGLPYISRILLGIYKSIGQNFDRVGNVRYAVTYKPADENDRIYAKDRAQQIAREWAAGMSSATAGEVRDFIAVGDVDIKVIGAENQILDTQVPVRLLLEQLVSKLSIPPFLLGLSWSSTERMSAQQVDILTSELDFFRRCLDAPLRKIAMAFLEGEGLLEALGNFKIKIYWDSVNLQDETELADARLKLAQAADLEWELEQKKKFSTSEKSNVENFEENQSLEENQGFEQNQGSAEITAN